MAAAACTTASHPDTDRGPVEHVVHHHLGGGGVRTGTAEGMAGTAGVADEQPRPLTRGEEHPDGVRSDESRRPVTRTRVEPN